MGQRGWTSGRPEVALGPGYQVRLHVSGLEELDPRSYDLVVYPFAEGAPRAYTPSYEREIGQNEWVPMGGGWSRLPTSFKSWFIKHVASAPPARESGVHTVIPVGLVLVAIGLALAVHQRYQHRLRPRAA